MNVRSKPQESIDKPLRSTLRWYNYAAKFSETISLLDG